MSTPKQVSDYMRDMQARSAKSRWAGMTTAEKSAAMKALRAKGKQHQLSSVKAPYVIQRCDGKFWCGPGRWSDEYPDAFLWTNWKLAAEEAMNSTDAMMTSKIVADYGLDSERILMTIEGSILMTIKGDDQ